MSLNSTQLQQINQLIENLQEKFLSIENVQQHFLELIQTLLNTHQTIMEQLNFFQNIIKQYQSNIQQQQRSSPLSISSTSTISLNNSILSTNTNNKRIKSPKSVTFSFDQNNDQQQPLSTPIENDHSQTIIEKKHSLTNLFEQHHENVTTKPNIGYQLGNGITNVRIHEIESNGEYLRLLNVSNTDDYDLSQHYLQQNLSCVPFSRFKFPSNTLIRSGQTITIWCGLFQHIETNPPHVFVWKESRRWETGPECITILAKPTGQAIAWARSSNRIQSDQSSSDILFVHSKPSTSTPSSLSDITNSSKNVNRLSSYNYIGNGKPPFAHSPSNSIHPSHDPINNQYRFKRAQLLTRPKSSPFSNYQGCQKDSQTINYLHKYPIR